MKINSVAGALRSQFWICLWTGAVLCAPALPAQEKLSAEVQLECSTNTVGQYEKVEFALQAPTQYTNPFNPDEVDLSLHITTPKGHALIVPAFYCQSYERRRLGTGDRPRDWLYPVGLPAWRARFAPAETGRYEAMAVLKDASGAARSKAVRFRCVASSNRGFVRVSQKDPRFLEFTTGQPFFMLGQNLAFIGSQQYVTLSRAEEIFGKLAENGANYLRLWTCCEDWAMAIEARKSAWSRSWDQRAPIAAMPGVEGASRKCIRLSGEPSRLNVNPSHPVALRPSTRYIVSGKFRAEREGALQLEVHGTSAAKTLASAQTQTWIPFTHEFETGSSDYWLGEMGLAWKADGTAWLSDLSLREAAGGPELLWEADVNHPLPGYYNPLDSFMLDEVVAAAEKRGIFLQLCLVTRDLYMDSLKNPASAEYELAITSARKLFRYAIGRWGYSTSVAAWEYWNEMNPGLPTDRFYTALGEYLEQADVYHHLRTTSTWGPSAKDCRHPKLDIADTHFYLRPSDKGRLRDEVEAVADRTRWLREQAPNKPAHLGEFGMADEKWAITDEMKQSPELVDAHNALWASALSGASGTAMFWWWERLDQRNFYPDYRPLSRFISDVPWNQGTVRPAELSCSDDKLRTVGLRSLDSVWFWIFNIEASWAKVVTEKRPPSTVSKAVTEIRDLPKGSYQVRWSNTRQGNVLLEEKTQVSDGLLRLAAPDFDRDIACRVVKMH